MGVEILSTMSLHLRSRHVKGWPWRGLPPSTARWPRARRESAKKERTDVEEILGDATKKGSCTKTAN